MTFDEMLERFTRSDDAVERNSLAVKLAATGTDRAFEAILHSLTDAAIGHKGTLVCALSLFVHRPDLFNAAIIALLRQLAAEAPTMEARTEAAALVRAVAPPPMQLAGDPCEWR